MSDTPPPTLLYCRCAYAQVVPTGVKNDVLERLASCNKNFEAVSDLCEFAAHRDPRLAELKQRASDQGLQIIACYPRVVKGLFQQAGQTLPSDNVSFLNMRTQTADEIINQIDSPAP